jgi:hypothetical protein
MLCAKDLKRSDNLNRHIALCHKDREEYVGYKACTDFTFSCVGADYPHMFVAEKKGSPNQYVGYCTGCYKAVSLPQYTRSMENACKHIKEHTCAEKQVRTRKVIVQSEDVSGNIVLKKEMQTGGVKFTEEMMLAYKKRPDMRYAELETMEDCSVDVLTSIENALKDSSKLKSPAMKAALTAQPAAPVVSAVPVADGDIDWTRVCKELSTHRRLKVIMPVMMRQEEERIKATVQASLNNADEEAEELDWFEFMSSIVYRAKKMDDETARCKKFEREKNEALDNTDRERARATGLELKLQQECQAAARREAERDEEIRTLRAALQQCQSKIELVVDDKKF